MDNYVVGFSPNSDAAGREYIFYDCTQRGNELHYKGYVRITMSGANDRICHLRYIPLNSYADLNAAIFVERLRTGP